MSNIQSDSMTDGTLEVTINMPVSTYRPAWESELNKLQKKANIKGFRQGKAPMSYIRTLHGGSVLYDTVFKMVDKELEAYLKERGIRFLGQPLPSKDHAPQPISEKDMKDLEFKFVVGQVPAYELKGLDNSITIKRYDQEVADEEITEEWNKVLLQYGKLTSADDTIIENDLVKAKAIEMEGSVPKAGGYETEIKFLFDFVTNDALKTELKSKKVGDSFFCQTTDMERETDKTWSRKQVFNINEEEGNTVGDFFQCTIEEITRRHPADVNQEFLDRIFGEESGITDEQEAKNRIREVLTIRRNNPALGLFLADIKDKIIEANNFPLPEDFILRLIEESKEEKQKRPEGKEKEDLINAIRWNLIREDLLKQNSINVTPEELKDQVLGDFAAKVGIDRSYPGLEQFADKLMENKESVQNAYLNIQEGKLLESIKGKFNAEIVSISKEEFETMLNERFPKPEAHDHDHDHDHDHENSHHEHAH